MRRSEKITSTANAKLKSILALAKSRERAASGSFVIEGVREISRACASGFAIISAWFCPDIASPEAHSLWTRLASTPDASLYELGREAYAKVAVREDKDGLFVVARSSTRTLDKLALAARPLVLVVDGVEKPGNLGALLRSADGAGASAVIVLGAGCDLYNPHCIRASLGAVFSLPIVCAETVDFFKWCHQHKLITCAAALATNSQAPDAIDMSSGVALLVGSEAFGLSPELVAACDQVVTIPMLGIVDSLNVSVAGAVLLYEARRQIHSRR